MTKRSKRYLDGAKRIDDGRAYTPQEAVQLAKDLASARFDETVEVHLRTNADPRHADQQVRGVVVLPHGRGKAIRVLVFATGEAVAAAREAGADYIGDDELIQRIEKGWADFDVAIAIPEMMGRIGRLGRHLGRRGLMPNPRTGTVIQPADVPRAIAEARKGRVEFRMDRTGILHVPVGKARFTSQQLLENVAAVVESITRARPSGVKGQFLRSAYLTTTMGPSIKLDLPSTLALKVE